ncbi:MAG: heavy metal translocating P-type ATPase [Oscillatoria sp. PMC 1068.18]|nr:heavy metal translocating P-type ATPase [Oscillatoria sp. PMC 1076.18]MEC4988641.1 heavy metal translocating P-type ATPase [Oscillatoria sp. PMC 1068.18]
MQEEDSIDYSLKIASVNLVLAGFSLFYHPLIWLTIPILIYSEIPFFRLAYKSVFEERRLSSYVIDVLLVSGLLFGQFFYTEVIGIWFALLGRKMLLDSESNSRQSMSNLFDEQPRTVLLLTDEGDEREIPFEQLKSGDLLAVSAGQTIAVDGTIATGFASIDQHKLTGESQPVEKGEGDQVLASTIVLSGKIGVRVEKTGEETVASEIAQILEKTTDFKNSLQSKGEAIADQMTLPTLGLSALFFFLPGLGYASAVAVLTNTFGYKMRLFAPASMLAFLNLASKQGILVKDGRSLQIIKQVDTIVFDKTGTLTLEQPTVAKIHTCPGISEAILLCSAAAAEVGQTHPIAKAILKAAREEQLDLPKVIDAVYEMGSGIQVRLLDREVRVGSHAFMKTSNLEIPSELKSIQADCYEQGQSLVFVAFDNQVVGLIEFHATIRPEVPKLLESLEKRSMSMYILSGDHEAPTQKLAQTLGIKNYFANLLPENKAKIIKQLQEQGKSICFVGDGINDSIALKQANLSVSLCGATTIAIDTAQIVFMDSNLERLTTLFDIAERFDGNIRTGLLISIVPSIICIFGIILFHWGVITGMTITVTTLFVGIGNAVLGPWLAQKSETQAREIKVNAVNT